MAKKFQTYLRKNHLTIRDKSEIPQLDDLKVSEKPYSPDRMIDSIVRTLFDPSLVIVTTDLSKIYLGARVGLPSKGHDSAFDYSSPRSKRYKLVDIEEKDSILRAYQRAEKAHIDLDELRDYAENKKLAARLKRINKYFKMSKRETMKYRKDLGDLGDFVDSK